MKLSETQRNCLFKMEIGVWYSAYELGVRISTLEALHNKGLLKRKTPQLGYMFSPRASIEFMRTHDIN